MRIDPAIAALQADPWLQRRAQAKMIETAEAWRADPAAADAVADLDRFGAGAPLEGCLALEALFTDGEAAPALAASLCRSFAGALGEEPFGHPAMRHGFNGSASTLLLARSGRAQLILHAREPGGATFETVSFSDALRYEAVLAGEARARIVRPTLGPAASRRPFHQEALTLRAGTRLALDLGSEALQVLATTRRLVTLRLHRFAAEPGPSREYRLADGTLLHQAAGSIRTSRQEMMVALLGRMNVAQATPLMADMALEEGDSSLRWQALRECLALDTAAGFRALSQLARRADDLLAAPAGALRAQLVEAHPQLLSLETAPCPE
jgi:hypothetical protein